MQNHIHSEIVLEDVKHSILWEQRHVQKGCVVSFYDEKRILPDVFKTEERVYMGCTDSGEVIVANKDFSEVQYLDAL